jgi:O-antigen/teichoic acid export membrane protein
LALATLILSVLTGYNATLGAIQNSARQRAIVAIHSGLDAWLKIALIMGILLWFGVSSTAVVIGYAFSSLIITGSQFFFLRRFISTPATSTNNCGEWTQQMLAYAWPFTAWGFFTWLQQVSDRWSLGVFATTADVGLYAVLFQLGFTPITLVTGLTMSFLGPILYARSADASDPSRNANVHLLAWRFTFFCLLLTLASFLITLGMHEWLFHFFVAIQFRSVSYLLPWMVLAGGIFAAGQMLALKMMSDMKPASMTQAKVITALLGVLLNIYGASVAGLDGLVGAQIAFSIIYFVWMALLSSSFFSKNKFTS